MLTCKGKSSRRSACKVHVRCKWCIPERTCCGRQCVTFPILASSEENLVLGWPHHHVESVFVVVPDVCPMLWCRRRIRQNEALAAAAATWRCDEHPRDCSLDSDSGLRVPHGIIRSPARPQDGPFSLRCGNNRVSGNASCLHATSNRYLPVLTTP